MKRENEKIYKDGKILNESILFVDVNGERYVDILFEPKAIITIENLFDEQKLQEGKDFVVDGRRLYALNDCVKFLKNDWLFCKNVPEYIKDLGVEYGIKDILLMEPEFISKMSYKITYEIKDSTREIFPQYIHKSNSLLKMMSTIKDKINITLMGDSISNGANSSGEGNYPPFEKYWFDESINKFKDNHKEIIVNFYNRSRSGYGSEWGKTVAKSIWEDAEDDIFIIAFGMNDATDNLSTEKYISNIEYIINQRKNKNGALILISSILPNPNSMFFRQELRNEYSNELKKICKKYDASFIDMTTLSQYLIDKKRYIDISGNNFNHPNDFVYSFYSHALDSFLEK